MGDDDAVWIEPAGRDRRGRVIASMLPAAALIDGPGVNFITPEAAHSAAARASHH